MHHRRNCPFSARRSRPGASLRRGVLDRWHPAIPTPAWRRRGVQSFSAVLAYRWKRFRWHNVGRCCATGCCRGRHGFKRNSTRGRASRSSNHRWRLPRSARIRSRCAPSGIRYQNLHTATPRSPSIDVEVRPTCCSHRSRARTSPHHRCATLPSSSIISNHRDSPGLDATVDGVEPN